MGDELWSGQAQNGVYSDFEVKFDLEGQGQLPPKTIGTLTKVFCIFGPSLAILAWTGPKLSRGQASDWHTDWRTHTRTHTQTQAMTIPEGQNWPRVKRGISYNIYPRSLYIKGRFWFLWLSVWKLCHCCRAILQMCKIIYKRAANGCLPVAFY